MRGGVPERGADLRASLVPLHQHQRGLQRVRSKPPLKHFFNVDICWASCLMVQKRFDSTWSFSFMCVGTQSDVLLCLQAGLPMRRPGLRDEPPPPGLLGGARRMRPAARPAAVQLCRLQRQIQAPLPLQGLSQRPGGAMRGLPMTTQRGSGRKPSPPPRRASVFLKTAAKMSKRRPCSLTSDRDLAAKAGEIVKPLRDAHGRALKRASSQARVSVFASGPLSSLGDGETWFCSTHLLIISMENRKTCQMPECHVLTSCSVGQYSHI